MTVAMTVAGTCMAIAGEPVMVMAVGSAYLRHII